MCVSPLKILNNSSLVDCSCSKYYRFVPCGRCYQCRNQAVDDWTVRNFSEYKSSLYTYFYTLTFSNDHICHFRGLNCFSKEYIQLFLKRLRKRLASFDDRIVLRYFISSELGEHTHRPHYHALFYITLRSDSNKEFSLSSRQFQKFVRDSWQFGFVRAGDNLGLVNSAACIKYVVKYLLKTDTYYNKFARALFFRVARKWLTIYKSYDLILPPKDILGRGYLISYDSKNYPSTFVSTWNNFVYAARKEYAHFSSHHMQSQSLGAGAVDMYNASDNTCSDSALTSNYHYHTPRSVSRKLYYDRVYSVNDMLQGRQYPTTYKINGAGVAYYSRLVDKKIHDTFNSLTDYISDIKHSDFNVLVDILHCSNYHLDKLMRLSDSDKYKLSVYLVAFRYLHVADFHIFERLKGEIFKPLNVRKIVRTMLSQSNYSMLVSRDDFLRNYTSTITDLPQCAELEIFATIIDFYQNYVNALKSAENMRNLIQTRKLKSKLYHL